MVKLAAPGSIAAFGDATFLGAPAGHTRDIVGIASSGYGQGYWALGSGGGVFSYGDARFLGSLGDRPPLQANGWDSCYAVGRRLLVGFQGR